MWDHVEFVEGVFAAWRQTRWPAVDVDAMLMSAGSLQREVRGLVRHSCSWGVHKGLAQMLSDMLVALPLVQAPRGARMRTCAGSHPPARTRAPLMRCVICLCERAHTRTHARPRSRTLARA